MKRIIRYRVANVSLLIILFLIPCSAIFSAPPLINIQGRLTDVSGQAVSDGDKTVTFTIYTDSAAGNSVWSEINTKVNVNGGQFNVLLGSISPLHYSVFAGDNRWLGIKVGTDPEMTPRSRLASVAYAQRAATIDGAKGGSINGPLGVGIANPDWQVHVKGGVAVEGTGGAAQYALKSTAPDGHQYEWYLDGPRPGCLSLYDRTAAKYRITFDSYGNVGIGTQDPQTRLHVLGAIVSEGSGGNGAHITLMSTAPGGHQYEWYGDGADVGSLALFDRTLYRAGDQLRAHSIVVSPSGNVGIGGVLRPSEALEVSGTTKTGVLEITGGSDLAEPFEMVGDSGFLPGSVVAIDRQHPGRLKLASTPYDKCVAGVISGAGGITPGLTLRQEGVLETGTNVALTGRVYCLATTINGPIEAGDLLTTSSMAGHAMRATDPACSHGTVIGKAMSTLEDGEGLVLVLVNLQ